MRLLQWLFITCVLFIPALYMVALFGLPLFGVFLPFPLIREANPYTAWNVSASLHIIPFILVAFSYLIYCLYSIITLYFPRRKFSKKFFVKYLPFEMVHSFAILLSIPFLFPLGFFIVSALVMKSLVAFGPMQMVLGIILWIVWFRYRTSIFSRVLIVVALFIALSGIYFFAKESLKEFRPTLHGSFPLNDADGVYMINYDGDFWLTYYKKDQYCWDKNDQDGKLTKVCKVNLVKSGNTVIVESSTDLKKYLDKSVRVSGSFVPVIPPIRPGKDYREFCITKPKRQCSDSKGPGTWYYSPLKIQTIKLRN